MSYSSVCISCKKNCFSYTSSRNDYCSTCREKASQEAQKHIVSTAKRTFKKAENFDTIYEVLDLVENDMTFHAVKQFFPELQENPFKIKILEEIRSGKVRVWAGKLITEELYTLRKEGQFPE